MQPVGTFAQVVADLVQARPGQDQRRAGILPGLRLLAATARRLPGVCEVAAIADVAQALPIARAFNDWAQIALIDANLAKLEAKLGNCNAAIERAHGLARHSRA